MRLGDLTGDRRRLTTRDARFGARRTLDADTRIAVRDEFFIIEPQANVFRNVTRRYRLSVGVGYRLVGAAPLLGDLLEGLSGSVSMQIGGR